MMLNNKIGSSNLIKSDKKQLLAPRRKKDSWTTLLRKMELMSTLRREGLVKVNMTNQMRTTKNKILSIIPQIHGTNSKKTRIRVKSKSSDQ